MAAALSPTILHGQSAIPAPALPRPAGTIVNVSTEAQLQAAVRRLASNTTIVLAPGTYQLTKTLSIAGPLTNVAVRGATDNADQVVLRGAGMANASSANVVDAISTVGGVSGLTIANLTIRDFPSHAIVFNPGTQSPHVYNVHLVDAGERFITSRFDASAGGVDNGVLEYAVIEYTTTGKDAQAGGVEVQKGDNWTIRHNVFRNIVAPAGELAEPALLMWKASSNSVTEANTFLNCAVAIGYGRVATAGGDARGGVIRNNFIYRSSAQSGEAGISVVASPKTEVLNNTVYLSGTYATPIEYRLAGSTGVVLANNLLDGFIWARDGATGSEQNNLSGATDSTFVNAAAGDLHLAASATSAIDRGISVDNVANDWDGQPRPSGSAYDIGADEYVSSNVESTVNKTTSSALEAAPMAAAAAAASAPAIDVVTSADQTGKTLSASTPAFSTTASNELLLAFIATDSGTTPTTVTAVSGAGLTWQLVKRTNVQMGTSEIWRAFAAARLTGATVTATLSQSTTSSITVVSFSGVDTSGTNGSGAIGATGSGNANPGAPTATLTTTRANSWVFGVGNDWKAATARTIGPNQTMIHQHLSGAHTFWVQRTTSSTPASGTNVTINDVAPTADRYNLTIVEVLAAAAVSDTTAPTVSVTAPAAGATVSGTAVTVSATAADAVGVAGVQFKLDGVNLGAEDTTSPYSQVWNTTAVANGTHTLTAVARDAAGNVRTSVAVTVTVNNTVADTTKPTVSLTAPANGATVSGSAATVSANAADNVGVVGVQFLLDGALLGTEDTSAPYAITWNTTSTSNGSHALTARARDAAGNLTTSTAVTVSVANGSAAPTAPVIDVVTFADQTAKVLTASTTTFSTTAGNELLLAFIAADSGATPTTVTAVSGAGLTWQLVKRTNAQMGTSEIWRAFSGAVLSGASVTATLSQATTSSMTVVSFKGVDPSGTNGSGAIGATASGSANPGAPTATLTTTRSNSWVFGVGNDWTAATARTIGPNQTMIHQHLAGAHTFWTQRATSPTPAGGTSVTLNDVAPTADRYNLTIVEILPAAAGSDTTAPTVSMTAPATGATVSGTAVTVSATAADGVGVAGVQFKLDGANLGAEDTTSPYTQVWNTTAVANGTHTLTAVARDAAGNATTSATRTITVNNAGSTVPTSVVFKASVDHATVTSYFLEIFANGANPNTATAIASSDLGKGTPDGNGDITVNRATFFSALAPATYVMTVSSMGPGGPTRSAAITFTR